MSSVSNSIAAATPPRRGTQPGRCPECHHILLQDGRARASSPSPSSSAPCVAGRVSRATGFPYTRTEPSVGQIRKQLVFAFHLPTGGFCYVNKNCARLLKKKKKKERRHLSVKVFMNIFVLFWLQKKIFNGFVFLHKTDR